MTLTPNHKPTESEVIIAKKSSKILASLQNEQVCYTIKVIPDEMQSESVTIPAAALNLLVEILENIVNGNVVNLTSFPSELDIYQAANILGVSKDYVWDLLSSGEIPYTSVRDTRKMCYEDVIEYKNRSLAKSMKALDELAAQAQELNMGY